MSDHSPPPLPEELQDWGCLPLELFRKPWEHFAPFLASYGYTLAHSIEYDNGPEEEAPTKPPTDPFHPADDEAFLYKTLSGTLKDIAFFQWRSTGFLALDRQHRNVYIKSVPRASSEWQIIQFLSTDPLRADPRNHTIPHVSIIPAGEWMFIVQACWSLHWYFPPLDSVNIRLEMARQVLEGVAFMHENGVGHGDIHSSNILWNHNNNRKFSTPKSDDADIPFHSTFDCRFAFIDFGYATRFPLDAKDHFITASHAPPSHFAAPEQSRDEPSSYDVFASDVFNVARVLEDDLEDAKKRSPAAVATPVVAPSYITLLKSMTRPEPSERPSAAEALESLVSIIASLPSESTVANGDVSAA